MAQYASYKLSGTPWIGDMPSHWEKKRLRFVCEFRNGYTPSKANQDFWTDGTIPWYRMEDIRDSGRFLNEAKQYVTEEAVKGQGLFEAGSFILATTATIGEHAMLIVDSLANQRFTNLKIRKSLGHSCLKEFFFYYLFLIDEFCKSSTRTATFPAMNMEDLRNFDVAIPPLVEQQAIAAYLDRKCDSIDKVIATQERRIALFSELKQSIITEAVTRGLNPDAPLKDSGIDWIGQIPEHWEVMKIAHLYNFIGSGTTPATGVKEYYEENGINWLQTGDLTDGIISETSKHISSLAKKELNLKIYPKGSLVVAMYGATVGKLGLLDVPTTVNQACCVLVSSKHLYNKFSFYSFLAAKKSLIVLSAGGGQPNISQDIIRNHHTMVPPIDEQVAIVEYLDNKCSRIDSAIAKAKREIELLREFKQSVITEAVTGKIKVC